MISLGKEAAVALLGDYSTGLPRADYAVTTQHAATDLTSWLEKQASHDVCCMLCAVVRANGEMVSRKTLIEAIGRNLAYYDECRLESNISRLRRKLSATVPDGFPIRAVRGHGYVFWANFARGGKKVAVRDAQHLSAIVRI